MGARKDEGRAAASSPSKSTAIIVDDVGGERAKEERQTTRRKVHPSIEAQLQMLVQERMQKQRGVERFVELDKLQKMAVVLKVAVEIQNRCRAKP